jgi:hypothetical protein
MRRRSRLGSLSRFLRASLSTINVQVMQQFFEGHVFAARDRRLSPHDVLEFARLGIDDRNPADSARDVLPDRFSRQPSAGEFLFATHAIERRDIFPRERRRDGLFGTGSHRRMLMFRRNLYNIDQRSRSTANDKDSPQ